MSVLKGISLSCYACRPGLDLEDFLRVLAQGNVGVTVYRYRRRLPGDYQSATSPRETIILYTKRDCDAKQHEHQRDMNLEMFGPELSKCVNYCARCKAMMRRIDALFYGDPSTYRPADLSELFSCPPCSDIVYKFRKFTADATLAAQDSELIHLQRLASARYDVHLNLKSIAEEREGIKHGATAGVAGAAYGEDKKYGFGSEGGTAGTTEDLEGMGKDKKAGVAGRATNLGWKEKDEGSARKTKYLEGREKDKGKETGTTRITKATEGKQKQRGMEGGAGIRSPKKLKETQEKTRKSKAGTTKPQNDEEAASSRRIVKGGKRGDKGMGNTSFKSKIAMKDAAGSKSEMDFNDEIESGMIRNKIAEHIRARERALAKRSKGIEDKMLQDQLKEEAARMAMANAEADRQLKFQEAMQLIAVGDLESEEPEICSQRSEEGNDIIRGDKIYTIKYKPVKQETEEETSVQGKANPPRLLFSRSAVPDKALIHPSSPFKRDGVLRYALSERKYINRGWTQLPKEMVMRKVAVYLMRPVRANYDWLELNKNERLILYDSGEQLATFDENGTRLYYRTGGLAMEYYKAEDTKAGQRVVVYSTGKPEGGRTRPRTVLALFDYSGNGAVYDHIGQIRLKYSQTEGLVLDRTIAPHTHWKWHNLNDSPLLSTVLIENQPLQKDPRILKYAQHEITISKDTLPDEHVMRSIEAQNIIKEKKRLVKKYAPLEIKMKVLKINEHFSLRIKEQSSIVLSFTDGKTRLKINVGMILDPSVVVGEDFVEVGDVNDIETKPGETDSVVRLQKTVIGARAAEQARVLHERRIHDTPSYLFENRLKR